MALTAKNPNYKGEIKTGVDVGCWKHGPQLVEMVKAIDCPLCKGSYAMSEWCPVCQVGCGCEEFK